jgi:large subunit ribosomal protein L18
MDSIKKKRQRRLRIKMGIRKKIKGTPDIPRLSVFRSNSHIYGQIIDDIHGITLTSVGSLKPDFDVKGKTKSEIARLAGKRLAEKAVERTSVK